jgi:predicted transposase YbfD/YdcC
MRTALFLYLAQRGADFLIAVKHTRRKGFRLIRDRLTYGRRIPWRTSKREIKRGRDITWDLRAVPAPEWVMEQWPGSATIIAVRSHGTREGKPQDETRYYVSSLRTSAKAMLKAIRQRWSIEASWHWVRDVPLREDAHRYREDNGVQILATLRSLEINTLRLDGIWSITEGIAALAHDIKGLLRLLGLTESATATPSG